MGRSCSFPGCGLPVKGNGLCRSHYMQQFRGKSLTPIDDSHDWPLDKRFWHFVVKGATPEACWGWTGFTTGTMGYAAISLDHRNVRAHRVSWELPRGPVPDGLWELHRCDYPLCTNPAHLFLGTPSDNVQDMISKGRHRTGARSLVGGG